MTWQLHLRLGDDLEGKLRAYAEARGISIAAAVRVLLHVALDEELDR
jgi:hypothetical protein